MGLAEFNGAIVLGNFAKLSKRRPRNWVDKDYRILIPYRFKFRPKIGKTVCTCTHCIESYQPWYGWTWFHSEDCEIMKLLKRRPTIQNLWQFWDMDLTMIGMSE